MLALLACLATAPSPSAQGISTSSKVKVATTGNRSELVDTIPITQEAQVSPRVMMSLDARHARRASNGDQLEINAEAEITTDCRSRPLSASASPTTSTRRSARG